MNNTSYYSRFQPRTGCEAPEGKNWFGSTLSPTAVPNVGWAVYVMPRPFYPR